MISDALKYVLKKEKFEELGVSQEVLSQYMDSVKNKLLLRAGQKLKSRTNKAQEQVIQDYLVAILLSESPVERENIVNQAVLFLESLPAKTKEQKKAFIDQCVSIKDRRFKGLISEIKRKLYSEKSVYKYEEFRDLDNEQNLLKKDFASLTALIEELCRDFEEPKYEMERARIEAEKKAQNRFKELIAKLNGIGEKIREGENISDNLLKTEWDQIQESVNLEAKEIILLAPEYNQQVGQYLDELIRGFVDKSKETNVADFQRERQYESVKAYEQLIAFLKNGGGPKNGQTASEIKLLEEDLYPKTKKITETLKVLRKDPLCREVKDSAHAWFSTAQLKLNSLLVFPEDGQVLEHLQGSQRLIEKLIGEFEWIAGENQDPEAALDNGIRLDLEFLMELKEVLSQAYESEKRQEAATSKKTAANKPPDPPSSFLGKLWDRYFK